MRFFQLGQHLQVGLGMRQEVGLVGQQHGGQEAVEHAVRIGHGSGRAGRVTRPPGHQMHPPRGELALHVGDVIQAVGVREIDHERRRVRGLQRARDPGQRMRRRHGRQVEQLEVHVLEGQHAGLGILRRQRIDRALRRGPREPGVQRRLAGVGRAEQRNLRGTFRPHHERRSTAGTTSFRPLQFLVEFVDAVLEVRLQVVRALVARDHAQHLAQAGEPFFRIARLAQCLGGGLVLGAEIGRHGGAFRQPASNGSADV